MSDRYESLSDFYPYYLGEHLNVVCRSLHVLGCLIVLTFLFAGLLTVHRQLLSFVPFLGYVPASVGHYFL